MLSSLLLIVENFTFSHNIFTFSHFTYHPVQTGAALRHMEQQIHVNDHRVALNIYRASVLSVLELTLKILIRKAASCLCEAQTH